VFFDVFTARCFQQLHFITPKSLVKFLTKRQTKKYYIASILLPKYFLISEALISFE